MTNRSGSGVNVTPLTQLTLYGWTQKRWRQRWNLPRGVRKVAHHPASEEYLMSACFYVWGLLPLFISPLRNGTTDGHKIYTPNILMFYPPVCVCATLRVCVCEREKAVFAAKNAVTQEQIYGKKWHSINGNDLKNGLTFHPDFFFFVANLEIAQHKTTICTWDMQTNPELITTFTCTFFPFKPCYWRKQVWGEWRKSEKCLYVRCNYEVSGYHKLSHFHIFGWRDVWRVDFRWNVAGEF